MFVVWTKWRYLCATPIGHGIGAMISPWISALENAVFSCVRLAAVQTMRSFIWPTSPLKKITSAWCKSERFQTESGPKWTTRAILARKTFVTRWSTCQMNSAGRARVLISIAMSTRAKADAIVASISTRRRIGRRRERASPCVFRGPWSRKKLSWTTMWYGRARVGSLLSDLLAVASLNRVALEHL